MLVVLKATYHDPVTPAQIGYVIAMALLDTATKVRVIVSGREADEVGRIAPSGKANPDQALLGMRR